MPEHGREGTFGASRVSAIKSVEGKDNRDTILEFSKPVYVNRRCGDFMFRVYSDLCQPVLLGIV